MKKILLLLLITTLSISTNAQTKKFKDKIGLGMTVGGVGLSVGALLTVADQQWVPDNRGYYNPAINQYGSFQTQPLYKQGPRFYALVGGVTITITGLVTMITERDKKHKR